MNFRNLTLSLVAASTFALATPAAAEMEFYEDYEPAEGLVEMTTITVEEGQFETYLEGLRSTWIGSNEVAKELGLIEDYRIYSNLSPTDDTFDLVLVITYPSVATWAGSREDYMRFVDAYGKANIDQGNETVLKLYNQIREITGTYLLREIIVK